MMVLSTYDNFGRVETKEGRNLKRFETKVEVNRMSRKAINDSQSSWS